MTTGLYRKGMVIAIIFLFIGVSVFPSINGNISVNKTDLGKQTLVDNKEASSAESAIDWWSMFSHDAQHSGYSTSDAPNTSNVLWDFPTGDSVNWSSPAVTDGKVYIGSDDNNVYCLDAATGGKIWNRTMFKPRGPVAVSDSRVYIGIDVDDKDKTEKLFCLNASTGETIWSWDENNREEIIAAPTVVDGKVYVATSGYSYGTPDETVHVPGEVHCLDAENGDLLWESDIDGRFYWCSPAVAYGNVYVGSGYSQNISLFGSFYCLNATDGSLVWKRPRICDILFLGGLLPGCYSPAVADGKVYIGSTGRWTGNMHCLDAFSGKTIWTYRKFTLRSGSFFSPAIADGKVYAGSGGSGWRDRRYAALNTLPDHPSVPGSRSPRAAGETDDSSRCGGQGSGGSGPGEALRAPDRLSLPLSPSGAARTGGDPLRRVGGGPVCDVLLINERVGLSGWARGAGQLSGTDIPRTWPQHGLQPAGAARRWGRPPPDHTFRRSDVLCDRIARTAGECHDAQPWPGGGPGGCLQRGL